MLLSEGTFDIGAGHHMRQLRGIGDHFVMHLRCSELHPSEAQRQEEILQPSERFRGRTCHRGQDHAGTIEQIVLGIAEAGKFPARHGVAAAEVPWLVLGQRVQRRAYGLLHATAVDDPCAGLELCLMGGDPRYDRGGIQGNQHHVALGEVFLRQRAVDSAQ